MHLPVQARRRAPPALIAVALAASTAAWAGPPFITDDPVPVDLGHWEVYGFTAAEREQGAASGTLLGFDMNYGLAPDLHVHALVTMAFDAPAAGGNATGFGDVEIGAKYRILDAGTDDWWPQVAIYPAITFPTGDATRGLGDGHTRTFLPVWLQKDFGAWTTYGGVGYWTNPGAGDRDYWFAGWQLTRQVTDRFAVGGELVHRTADTIGGDSAAGFTLGGSYEVTPSYHLLVSCGRGLQNAGISDEVQYYIGLQWTD